jgi:beta-mannosidase
LNLNRRQFLTKATVATAAVCVWKPFCSTAHAAPATGGFLDLNGDWQVARAGTNDWLPAVVPGCIHTDLLAAGKISDPFYRDNSRSIQWVGEADWVYRRQFHVPVTMLKRQKVLLHCQGLDTLAAIKVNGQEISQTDNMFRVWEFDVKPALQAGQNEIEITFASPVPYILRRQAQHPLPDWSGPHQMRGRAWVRKEPCNFGWDWAPVLITCGIWRNIGLMAFDQARLMDVLILQHHLASGAVRLEVEVAAESLSQKPLQAALRVSHQGQQVAATKISLRRGKGRGVLEIREPALWWPTGMGEQPLYEVEVDLLGEEGGALDRQSRRIGLRTLKLLKKDEQQPLHFEVNGVPFFAKGANWIPADTFATRLRPEILRRYVADAATVNMNTLRFWGGGYYEEDALYDACDEMGICVWLDFKFACSGYPAFDDAFMENVRQEARDNLHRLRHHPCIAVWCGNNEISLLTAEHWTDKTMGRADYDLMFEDLIGSQVKELAPQASYVSGSPDCGDTHYWDVWHGSNKPFDAYRSVTGFMSEFGFQSFPEPKTVRAFTNETDRASVLTPVMEWHQRDGSGRGNEIIRDTTLRYFNPPKDFDNALWLSQILQGYGIKIGAEYWRQTMPKSMGCLYWQYNDCWPSITWSSVDYFGRWKALHYLARRFYSPLLVSGLADSKAGTIEIFVSSDQMSACRGKLIWQASDVKGQPLTQGSLDLEVAARESRKVKTLDFGKLCREQGSNNILTWLKLEVDRKTKSDNLILFVRPKDIRLADPRIKIETDEVSEGVRVTLTAESPALWAWLNLDGLEAKYSDNFIHLAAGAPTQIVVRPDRPISVADFTRSLRVQSLFDTYSQFQKTSAL